jgi:hypothetical protein
MASYGARLYNAAGEKLPTLPLLGVQAGTVVNGVGECVVTFARQARPRAPWKDAFYVDVWRLDAPAHRVGAYWLDSWTERAERGAVTWTMKGKTPLHFLAGREVASTTLTGNACALASTVITSATNLNRLPYVTWAGYYGSAEGPSIALEVRSGNGLALLQQIEAAAFNLGRPKRVCYDILPTYTTSNRLALMSAVWFGEYGADRRVGYGPRPVALRIDAATRDYEAAEDWSKLVTVVNVTTLTTVTSQYLDIPPSNRWERTIGASGSSVGNATAQARQMITESEPRLSLPIDLGRDAWRLGLRLGDVVSVAYGGRWGTGRLNVLHVAADGERETVQARLDIEL